MPEFIDHITLSRMLEAGAVHGVQVVGQTGGWTVIVKYRKNELPLGTGNTSVVRVW